MSLEIIIDAREFEQMKPIKVDETEIFKNSFKHYLPEIVEVIKDLKKKDIYCYNSTVAEHSKHLGIEENLLNHFVYTSQSYLRNKANFDKLQNYKETYKDWQEPKEDVLREMSKNKTYVMVVGLGKEPFKARPFFDAEDNLFWMKPRYTRKGYRLNLTKYKKL